MARTVLEVFLSSTAADLKPHRDAVYARLARIEFIKCVRQEDFGAQNAEAMQYCCERSRTADLFVGMIGLRRGWEPHGDNANRSITEMEYDCAKDAGRGRYLWVSPDDFPVPGNLRETDAEHERQLVFRKRVMAGGERIVSQKGFASPEALASEIVEQLLAHVVTSDLIKLLRPELAQAGMAPIEDQKPAIAAAIEKLAEDNDVDLLALARNPQGVNIADLEAKLTLRAQQHAAAGTRETTLSAEYWRHIGALAFLHNTDKALTAYQKATALDPHNAEALCYVGELQFRLGDLRAATKTFDALVNLGKRLADRRAESMGCTRLGWIRLTQGDLAAAETLTTDALRLAEEWPEGMARAHLNLGNIHHMRGHLKKAEQMYRKALALSEELGSNEGMAANYGNLGAIHAARGEFDKAEQMHHKALALDVTLGNKQGMAQNYSNLGVIHDTRGELDQAEQMYQMALRLNDELGRKEGLAKANWNLAFVYEKKKNKARLCEHLRRARNMWLDMGLSHEVADADKWLKIAGCSDA